MKNPWMKRLLSGTLAAAMASTVLVGIPSQAAEEAGIPYDEQGNYNVQIPHVMVNQVYGGSDDGYASHSFIELYNPCDTAVDLNGWELQYQSSPDGEEDGWQELTLTGTIPAGGYYLVRCGVTTDAESGAYQVPEGDQEWDVVLHNKGVSVALFSEDVTLKDDFPGRSMREIALRGMWIFWRCRETTGRMVRCPWHTRAVCRRNSPRRRLCAGIISQIPMTTARTWRSSTTRIRWTTQRDLTILLTILLPAAMKVIREARADRTIPFPDDRSGDLLRQQF